MSVRFGTRPAIKAPADGRKRNDSNGQKILRVIGACVAAMLAAEGALRLSGKAQEASFFIADRELGWSLRPGAEGWSLRERPVYVRINRDGLLDRDHDVAKPPERLRIAIPGDSYAEAMSVDLHHFWAELERRVARCRPDGAPLEVLNFGVSGYGTGQQLLQLRRIWTYAPDIVVLAFYPGERRGEQSAVREGRTARAPRAGCRGSGGRGQPFPNRAPVTLSERRRSAEPISTAAVRGRVPSRRLYTAD
jgi:hypothetical protein